jgi:hypothetical protein
MLQEVILGTVRLNLGVGGHTAQDAVRRAGLSPLASVDDLAHLDSDHSPCGVETDLLAECEAF